MSTEMNSARTSNARGDSASSLRRTISCVGLCCLFGCALDYDYLKNGHSSAAGGKGHSAGTAGRRNLASGGTSHAGGTDDGGNTTTDAVGGWGAGAGEGGGGGTTSDVTSNGGSSIAGGSHDVAGSAGVTAGGAAAAGATSGPTGVTIGTAGAPTIATGVAVLTVPLSGVAQGQRFNYANFTSRTPSSYDLTGAVLNIVACAPGATGGNLHIFFTTPNRVDSFAFDVALTLLTTGFQTISIPVPAATGQFSPGTIMVIRIEVEAGYGFGTTWQTPATLVYIDRIWTTNGVLIDNFDSSFSGIETSGVRDTPTPSGVSWVSSYVVPVGSGGTTSTGGSAGKGGSAGASGFAGSPHVGGSNAAGNGGAAAGAGGN